MFTGKNCDVNINECASSPCLNNGYCIDEVNSYRCICQYGDTGPNCELSINFCDPNYCMNGATCHSLEDKFTCECSQGFNGTRCELDVDECTLDPCGRGRCINTIGGFICECDIGFGGSLCTVEIDECLVEGYPCRNSGTCVDLVAEFRCKCREGFTGSLCEVDINECDNITCENGGHCIDLVNSFVCDCQTNFTGSLCETDMSLSFTHARTETETMSSSIQTEHTAHKQDMYENFTTYVPTESLSVITTTHFNTIVFPTTMASADDTSNFSTRPETEKHLTYSRLRINESDTDILTEAITFSETYADKSISASTKPQAPATTVNGSPTAIQLGDIINVTNLQIPVNATTTVPFIASYSNKSSAVTLKYQTDSPLLNKSKTTQKVRSVSVTEIDRYVSQSPAIRIPATELSDFESESGRTINTTEQLPTSEVSTTEDEIKFDDETEVFKGCQENDTITRDLQDDEAETSSGEDGKSEQMLASSGDDGIYTSGDQSALSQIEESGKLQLLKSGSKAFVSSGDDKYNPDFEMSSPATDEGEDLKESKIGGIFTSGDDIYRATIKDGSSDFSGYEALTSGSGLSSVDDDRASFTHKIFDKTQKTMPRVRLDSTFPGSIITTPADRIISTLSMKNTVLQETVGLVISDVKTTSSSQVTNAPYPSTESSMLSVDQELIFHDDDEFLSSASMEEDYFILLQNGPSTQSSAKISSSKDKKFFEEHKDFSSGDASLSSLATADRGLEYSGDEDIILPNVIKVSPHKKQTLLQTEFSDKSGSGQTHEGVSFSTGSSDDEEIRLSDYGYSGDATVRSSGVVYSPGYAYSDDKTVSLSGDGYLDAETVSPSGDSFSRNRTESLSVDGYSGDETVSSSGFAYSGDETVSLSGDGYPVYETVSSSGGGYTNVKAVSVSGDGYSGDATVSTSDYIYSGGETISLSDGFSSDETEFSSEYTSSGDETESLSASGYSGDETASLSDDGYSAASGTVSIGSPNLTLSFSTDNTAIDDMLIKSSRKSILQSNKITNIEENLISGGAKQVDSEIATAETTDKEQAIEDSGNWILKIWRQSNGTVPGDSQSPFINYTEFNLIPTGVEDGLTLTKGVDRVGSVASHEEIQNNNTDKGSALDLDKEMLEESGELMYSGTTSNTLFTNSFIKGDWTSLEHLFKASSDRSSTMSTPRKTADVRNLKETATIQFTDSLRPVPTQANQEGLAVVKPGKTLAFTKPSTDIWTQIKYITTMAKAEMEITGSKGTLDATTIISKYDDTYHTIDNVYESTTLVDQTDGNKRIQEPLPIPTSKQEFIKHSRQSKPKNPWLAARRHLQKIDVKKVAGKDTSVKEALSEIESQTLSYKSQNTTDKIETETHVHAQINESQSTQNMETDGGMSYVTFTMRPVTNRTGIFFTTTDETKTSSTVMPSDQLSTTTFRPSSYLVSKLSETTNVSFDKTTRASSNINETFLASTETFMTTEMKKISLADVSDRMHISSALSSKMTIVGADAVTSSAFNDTAGSQFTEPIFEVSNNLLVSQDSAMPSNTSDDTNETSTTKMPFSDKTQMKLSPFTSEIVDRTTTVPKIIILDSKHVQQNISSEKTDTENVKLNETFPSIRCIPSPPPMIPPTPPFFQTATLPGNLTDNSTVALSSTTSGQFSTMPRHVDPHESIYMSEASFPIFPTLTTPSAITLTSPAPSTPTSVSSTLTATSTSILALNSSTTLKIPGSTEPFSERLSFLTMTTHSAILNTYTMSNCKDKLKWNRLKICVKSTKFSIKPTFETADIDNSTLPMKTVTQTSRYSFLNDSSTANFPQKRVTKYANSAKTKLTPLYTTSHTVNQLAPNSTLKNEKPLVTYLATSSVASTSKSIPIPSVFATLTHFLIPSIRTHTSAPFLPLSVAENTTKNHTSFKQINYSSTALATERVLSNKSFQASVLFPNTSLSPVTVTEVERNCASNKWLHIVGRFKKCIKVLNESHSTGSKTQSLVTPTTVSTKMTLSATLATSSTPTIIAPSTTQKAFSATKSTTHTTTLRTLTTLTPLKTTTLTTPSTKSAIHSKLTQPPSTTTLTTPAITTSTTHSATTSPMPILITRSPAKFLSPAVTTYTTPLKSTTTTPHTSTITKLSTLLTTSLSATKMTLSPSTIPKSPKTSILTLQSNPVSKLPLESTLTTPSSTSSTRPTSATQTTQSTTLMLPSSNTPSLLLPITVRTLLSTTLMPSSAIFTTLLKPTIRFYSSLRPKTLSNRETTQSSTTMSKRSSTAVRTPSSTTPRLPSISMTTFLSTNALTKPSITTPSAIKLSMPKSLSTTMTMPSSTSLSTRSSSTMRTPSYAPLTLPLTTTPTTLSKSATPTASAKPSITMLPIPTIESTKPSTTTSTKLSATSPISSSTTILITHLPPVLTSSSATQATPSTALEMPSTNALTASSTTFITHSSTSKTLLSSATLTIPSLTTLKTLLSKRMTPAYISPSAIPTHSTKTTEGKNIASTSQLSVIRHIVDLTSNNTYPNPRREITEYIRNRTIAKKKAVLKFQMIKVTVIRTVSKAAETGRRIVLQSYRRVKDIATKLTVTTYARAKLLLKQALHRIGALWQYCKTGINHFVVKPLLNARVYVRHRFEKAYTRLGQLFERGRQILDTTVDTLKKETSSYFENLATYYSSVYRQYTTEVKDIFDLLKIPDS